MTATPDSSAPKQPFVSTAISPAQLSDDEVACISVGDLRVALLRRGASVIAFIDECPHGDTSFEGERLRGGHLRCPLHGACFDPDTGIPLSGPAQTPLTRLASRIDANGHIAIALPTQPAGET